MDTLETKTYSILIITYSLPLSDELLYHIHPLLQLIESDQHSNISLAPVNYQSDLFCSGGILLRLFGLQFVKNKVKLLDSERVLILDLILFLDQLKVLEVV